MSTNDDSPFRDRAIAVGKAFAKKLFDGRTGHGGSVRAVYRQVDEKTLALWFAAAFELGAEFGQTAAHGARATVFRVDEEKRS